MAQHPLPRNVKDFAVVEASAPVYVRVRGPNTARALTLRKTCRVTTHDRPLVRLGKNVPRIGLEARCWASSWSSRRLAHGQPALAIVGTRAVWLGKVHYPSLAADSYGLAQRMKKSLVFQSYLVGICTWFRRRLASRGGRWIEGRELEHQHPPVHRFLARPLLTGVSAERDRRIDLRCHAAVRLYGVCLAFSEEEGLKWFGFVTGRQAGGTGSEPSAGRQCTVPIE
ncbi:hypothetical protein DFP72DRAFT_851307 [Ephemerocybe angulata]|uniref:Uncharacterized protein n=1 Tax=Ephemerocybe angulata TaxID=980116 RepID=A0A8H6HR17_9AGAR|nr:hypothetical protein DFP72DRAFT_851307 [Tulosesus angulatus]